ncbi:LysR substrate-binding domain-containing protein, partial [Falsiroseomonas selenitidurans]
MELRHLRYFLAVAAEGQVTRAAEALHVSQPTLSQQLRQLEEEVGAPLFERLHRGLRLTPAGEALRLRAARALAEVAAARQDIAALEGLARGTLALGVIHTLSATLLPRALARFRAAHPGVTVAVAPQGTARDIEDGVAEGALDLGIAFAPPLREDTEAEFLFEEELALILRRGHPLLRAARGGARLPVRALQGVPLALLSGRYATRRLIERCFEQAGAGPPEVALEIDAIGGLIATVSATDLATVLSDRSVPPGLPATLLRLRDPTPVRRVALLWRRGGVPAPAAQAFAAVFR